MPHDDFATEVSPGLAKALPPGERVLWQGRPTTWALAREAMLIRPILAYFVLLGLARAIILAEGDPAAGVSALVFYGVLAALAAGIILGIAAVLARTTLYTLTTGRVVLRIGAALTVSLNLPLKDIAAADMVVRRDGSGSIFLKLTGGAKISYLVLWPHARPWRMSAPEPSLRAIPEVEKVAAILGEAATGAAPARIIPSEVPEPGAVPVPAE